MQSNGKLLKERERANLYKSSLNILMDNPIMFQWRFHSMTISMKAFSPGVNTWKVCLSAARAPADHPWNITRWGVLTSVTSCDDLVFCTLTVICVTYLDIILSRSHPTAAISRDQGPAWATELGMMSLWIMWPDLSLPDKSPFRPQPPRRTACLRLSSWRSSRSHSWSRVWCTNVY